MENCFRFLINVDQCLNMSYFDIFFYKLESQHKFHMNSVQLFGEPEERSLRSAIMDIRMYLDKYPYHVGTYQVIVAMRSVFQEPVPHWEQTMLYRLLHLEHELKRAHILINSREQTQKALNLIMLYDADFSAELTNPGNYMESSRLQQDCALLLTQLSLSGVQPSQKNLEQAVDTYCQQEGHDAIAARALLSFLEKRRGDLAHLAAMAPLPRTRIPAPPLPRNWRNTSGACCSFFRSSRNRWIATAAGSDSMFCESDPQKQRMDLRNILKGFMDHRFSLNSMQSEWSKAYKDCSQLRSYAENLSRQ